MTPTAVTTSEALNLAADYLHAFGWTSPGGWGAVVGQPTCAEGALDIVCGVRGINAVRGIEIRNAAKRAVEAYLNLDGNPYPGRVVSVRYLWAWNDSIAESAEQVIETLRATALVEAAREDAALLAEAGRSA